MPKAITQELHRQQNEIETDRLGKHRLARVLERKAPYDEQIRGGYPGRATTAAAYVDVSENLAIERACKLLTVPSPRPAPFRAQANQGVFFRAPPAGDTYRD